MQTQTGLSEAKQSHTKTCRGATTSSQAGSQCYLLGWATSPREAGKCFLALALHMQLPITSSLCSCSDGSGLCSP